MRVEKFSEDLLRPIAKLCRRSMELDKMPDFLLKEKTIGDPDYDENITLAAFLDDEESPIGFIQGLIRERKDEKTGYIKLLCVAPEYRRRGVASELLRKVEGSLSGLKVDKIRIYESYPNYFMPGVDPFYTEAVCFFERNGYKKFADTSNLLADLTRNDFSTNAEEKKLERENIICRRAAQSDKEKTLIWVGKKFEGWIPEVTESFNADPVNLFITEVNGEVKAFSAHEVNNKGTGWFGPMGTDDSLRGKGIGGILLRKCLADMKRMGFQNAVIPWVGPIPFYMHYSGAKVSRVFWRYEKILG